MCKVTVSRMRERYAQMVLTFRITYVNVGIFTYKHVTNEFQDQVDSGYSNS